MGYQIHFSAQRENLCALVLILLLAGALAGCSSEVAPQSSVPSHFKSSPFGKALTQQEVLDLLEERQQFAKDKISEVCKLLEGVRDEASADTVSSKVEKINNELSDELLFSRRNTLSVSMTDEEYEQLGDSLRKSTEDFQIELRDNFMNRLANIGKKLGSNPKLRMSAGMRLAPAMSTLEMNVNPVETGTIFSFTRQYPEEQAAYIALAQVQGGEQLVEYLKAIGGFSNNISKTVDGKFFARIAPIDDLQIFVSKIDVGQVIEVDADARVIQLELSDADLASLKQKQKKREEEQRQAAKAEQKETQRKKGEKLKGEIGSVVDDRDRLLRSCLAQLQGITTVITAGEAGESIRSLCDEYRRAAENLSVAIVEYRQEVGVAPEYEDASQKLIQEIDEELDRVNSDAKLRVRLARIFGPNLNAKRLLEIEPPFHGYPNPAEDRRHADFLAANLIELQDGDVFERGKALERLATVDPTKVSDKRLRNEITRAIRDVALANDGRDADEALQPLVVWGGKYSVPILAQLLENEMLFSKHDDIIRLLGKYPSNEGAKAVAKFVGELGEHRLACETLLAMGSVAEEAVMEIAPSDDPEISLAAVYILGEIGSEKSLPLLRQGRSSTNRDVKRASSEAAKKIVRRTRQSEANEASKK